LCKMLEKKFGVRAVKERKERVAKIAARGGKFGKKAEEVDEQAIEAEMEKKLKGGKVESEYCSPPRLSRRC
jgi:hypothetical protein